MLQKLKNRRAESGFTLVELLIVIVVIAILAAIVINTFAGVQARARDTERQTDIKAIAGQLEVYHTNNGHYPQLATLSDTEDALTALEGLSEDALVDPQDNDGNSFQAATITATNKNYQYVQSDAAKTTACNAAVTACSDFVLRYWSEADNAAREVKSLSN